MMMLMDMKNRYAAARLAPVMLLALMLLGGCASQGDLKALKAENAWAQLEEDRRTGQTMDMVGGWMGYDTPDEWYTDAQDKAEREAGEAGTPIRALDKIVQDVSEYLVEKLPEHNQVASSEWRLSLGVGAFEDNTDDKRLGSTLNRIAERLMRNDQFNEHFLVLASSEEDADAILRELGTRNPEIFEDPTGETNAAGVREVHPDDLYILTGDVQVFSEESGRRLETVTNIRVTHPRTRQIVLSDTFRETYHFHPGEMKYITDADNESRQ